MVIEHGDCKTHFAPLKLYFQLGVFTIKIDFIVDDARQFCLPV